MKSLPVCLLLFCALSLSAQENYLLVGTYDSPKSEGIHVYRFNSNSGAAQAISHVNVPNPSYLAVSKDGRFVYAVLENAANGNGGEVAAFSFDKQSGSLRLLNRVSSGGDHPCYIELDRTGRWAFVANYTSGTVAVLPVQPGGELEQPKTVIRHEGSGPDTLRQKSPHAHSAVISADNKWLLVCDLGTDRIMIYAFDESTGSLTPAPKPFVTWVKSGPRHLAFHPNNRYAYMIGELGGVVVAYKYSNGTLVPFQKVETLAKDDTRFPGSADVHISGDGNYLYASNRGEVNSITRYRIHRRQGTLTLLGQQPVLGRTPRNFTFDPTEKFLLAANQNSDEIVVFRRYKKTGALSDSGNRIVVGKPVCLKWISIN
jgi:6-phosphogluconolactonase